MQAVTSTEAIPGRIEAGTAWIENFPAFAEQVLEWLPEDLVGAPEQNLIPTALEVVLPDYNETLRPTYAVPEPDSGQWLMLVQTVKPGLPLDEVDPEVEKGHGWKATLQAKFERLLRETQIPIGLLCNGMEIRLVYAPRGESSGHLTFPVQAMMEVAGRLILGALEMLIGGDRLFNVPSDRRLPKILSDSRDYQAEVSTKLADQVLDALWELLRGFQAADAAVGGALLQELAKTDPQHIYGGLLTTLMRLVFLLYAEDEGLMPDDSVYQQNYSVSGLYERLREDAGNYPDTMDLRYGAWTWLLSLFRLVYDGGGYTPEYLPARHGQLFEPDEYPFLEGRDRTSHFRKGEPLEVPRIPDGVIYRVLENLLMLDGERLSYRSLDVEQIGSVYEAIMGFEVQVTQGLSIAVRPKDVVVNVEALLATKPKDRAKVLKDEAECKLTGKALTALSEAKTPEELLAALDRKVSASRTPNLLPVGSLFLQPGEERRRSGSHYTPRKLTQPIVETTLRPVLEGLGERPTAEQILELKVCDLAMGSGAFLVEACRQLAEKVLEAWTRDDQLQDLPDDVEPLLAARRLVAQRCLYGVDKNPFAVNLAKLSLWLVTLAKDRPFTFVDHALKCGDSLVGVSKPQVSRFMAASDLSESALINMLEDNAQKSKFYRDLIAFADERADEDDEQKRGYLKQADSESYNSRILSDVVVASFFASNRSHTDDLNDEKLMSDVALAAFFSTLSKSKRDAKKIAKDLSTKVNLWRLGTIDRSEVELIASIPRQFKRPVSSFHWESEFPEVFKRKNPGFDVIAGNPPFAGKNTLINAHPEGYLAWLQDTHPESHGNADLVAHFFRRAFDLLRQGGSLGLIATNTIAQGDTRTTGLRFICNNGGTIYNAQKRVKWPGLAAVVISVVNIFKGAYTGVKKIDERETDLISAFLFHSGGNSDPQVLLANQNKSFQGSILLGMGFTFDDSNLDATSISEMHRLIEKDPRNQERIFPYIGGEEVNSSPTHAHHRYVIDFFDRSEEEAWKWPDLMQIVKDKVKPIRDVQKRDALRERWWQYAEKRPGLVRAIDQCDRVLVCLFCTPHLSFAFLPNRCVFANTLNVFALDSNLSFSILQSNIHSVWAWFFGSSMKDDLRYTPTDCFQTFPFPEKWEDDPTLEEIGKTYYEYRADLMVRNNQGLTDTYNRFHDPDEREADILKLRELHEQMDRAVLDAYGWSDIDTTCGFVLDYLDIDTDELPTEVQDRIASGDLFFPTVEEASTFDSLVRTGKRKLPWRYRWPEATHDEVLARLLDLNQKRHEEEVLQGKQSQEGDKSQGQKNKRKPRKSPASDSLTLDIPGLG
ncbi:DNA methyltransferase [Leptolyngbya sp. 'hensonii']|uniref:Eco57I restriction-modification methylase domain-containing protein n=1 Tax=Leptolyngbya sp. 'hensonii' TaxID=1922337 RepID=UPI00209AB07D|nr:DNA methyltransferase [Leptolyngbya sp. 'hensonii']